MNATKMAPKFTYLKYLILLLSIFVHTNSLAENNTGFVLLKLKRGVSLEIPRNWWHLDEEINNTIKTSSRAALDVTGIGQPEGKAINLLAANSTPKTTYASIRINSSIPPSALPSEVKSATKEDLKELHSIVLDNANKTAAVQGFNLVKFRGVRLDNISGYPAIVTEYIRTGIRGNVFVQVNQIFTTKQEIQMTIAYRTSEFALWNPVVLKMKKSLRID